MDEEKAREDLHYRMLMRYEQVQAFMRNEIQGFDTPVDLTARLIDTGELKTFNVPPPEQEFDFNSVKSEVTDEDYNEAYLSHYRIGNAISEYNHSTPVQLSDKPYRSSKDHGKHVLHNPKEQRKITQRELEILTKSNDQLDARMFDLSDIVN